MESMVVKGLKTPRDQTKEVVTKVTALNNRKLELKAEVRQNSKHYRLSR